MEQLVQIIKGLKVIQKYPRLLGSFALTAKGKKAKNEALKSVNMAIAVLQNIKEDKYEVKIV